MKLHKYFSLFLLLASVAAPASSKMVFHDDVIIQTEQTASDKLRLDVRMQDPTAISKIQASIGQSNIPLTDNGTFPGTRNGKSSSILFLIDTSDPRRQKAVDRAVQHLASMLSQNRSHLHYGLASFDTDLTLQAPLGSSIPQIIKKAKELKAIGKTTELYRNTLIATRILSRYPADRKFLVLFSDGLAEDFAYFHRDVVKSALDNGISIYTVGYASTISSSVALQTLRRLSEDTGGKFLPTSSVDYSLDKQQFRYTLDTMDSGRQYTADLSAAISAGESSQSPLVLHISSGPNSYRLSIPVRLPEPVIAEKAGSQPAQAQQPKPPVQKVIVQRTVREPAIDDRWTLAFIGIIAALVIAVLLLAFRQSGAGKKKADTSTTDLQREPDQKPYAWIEIMDRDKAERFPIRNNKTRIGRYHGNDIALPDPGISRYHAEIRYTGDGQFKIIDLGSKNGLLVNDDEVKEQILSDQDIIEMGDIRLRFISEGSPTDDMEDTQIFRTQVPVPEAANN
ncbi:MAG: FHA domain-containing protein [Gammaproteobacteria bacterium]|nr:MAG: FHA domain-containing protein [Gammaproteobacteria bacterium]